MDEKVALVKKEIINSSRFISNKIIDKEEADRIFKILLENYIFMDRNEAETNYNYKQIIPYIVVKYKEKFVLVRRTKKQSETRLHDKYSLGIGGHINDNDSSDDTNIIIKGLHRELREEIEVREPYTMSCAGIIDDESEDVGKVHIGIVYIVELSEEYFKILESEKMQGRWADKREIEDHYDHLEGWSKVLFNNFI